MSCCASRCRTKVASDELLREQMQDKGGQ